MSRSNCLFWAVWMFVRNGGYLVIRRCKHHKFCLHWLWMPSEGEPLQQYTGPDGATPPWWLGKILYKGRVKIGDECD